MTPLRGLLASPLASLLASLLAVGLTGPTPAAAADWPSDLRPVYVPEAPRSDDPDGEWVAVAAGDLLDLDQTLPPLIETLRLDGRFESDALIGSLAMTIRRPAGSSPRLNLGPVSLGLWDWSTATADDDPADGGPIRDRPRPTAALAAAVDAAGEGVLFLPEETPGDDKSPDSQRRGEQSDRRLTATASWMATGDAFFQQREFRLTLPPAVSTTLRLSLPPPLEVACEAALVQPPAEDATGAIPVWTLQLRRQAVVTLIIRPRRDGLTADRSGLRHDTSVVARIDGSGLSWTADLAVASESTIESSETRLLTLELPDDCVVDEVSVAGISLAAQSELVGGSLRVTVDPGPLPAAIRLQGRRPSSNARRTVPHPVVVGSRLRSAEFLLTCEPSLQVLSVDRGQLRQVSASLQSRAGDRLKFEASGPRPRLSVRVGPPRASLTGELLTVVEADPLATRLETLALLATASGSASELTLQLPEGWDWIDLVSLAGPAVLDWGLESERGVTTATATLATPLAARQSITLRVSAIRSADEEAFPLPVVRPIGATIQQSHLLAIGTAATGFVPDRPDAAQPATDDELIDEASRLVRYLDDRVANAGQSQRRAFRIVSPRGRLLRTQPDPVTPREPPRRVSAPSQSLATVSVQSLLAAPGGEHQHVATFHVRGGLPDKATLQLAPPAELIGVEADGRAIEVEADGRAIGVEGESGRLLLPQPDRVRSVVVRYRTPAIVPFWQPVTIPRPRLSVPTVDLAWSFQRPREIAVDHVEQTPAAAQRLDVISWQRRLFGPLGRRRGESPFRLQDLTDAPVDDPRGPLEVRLFDAPAAISLHLVDRGRTERLAWLALTACLLTGLLIRRLGLSGRGAATSLWAPLCFGLAWFLPPVAAPIAGAAGVGTLLGMLVPRRLIVRPRPTDPIDEGSTSIVAVPMAPVAAGLASALLIAAAIAPTASWAQSDPQGRSRNRPSGGPPGRMDVLVPRRPGDPLHRDDRVFVRPSLAEAIDRERSDRSVFVRRCRLTRRTVDGRDAVAVRWTLRRTAAGRGLRLPIETNVAITGPAEVGDREVTPIPTAARELLIPFGSEVPIGVDFDVSLTFLLPTQASRGWAAIWLPRCLDQLLSNGSRPPMLPAAVPASASTDLADGDLRMPPVRQTVWSLAGSAGPPLTMETTLGVLTMGLGSEVSGQVTVRGGLPGESMELRVPPRLQLTHVQVGRPTPRGGPVDSDRSDARPVESTQQSDPVASWSPVPFEQRPTRQRVLAPVGSDGVTRFRFLATLPGTGPNYPLPIQFVAEQTGSRDVDPAARQAVSPRSATLLLAGPIGQDFSIEAGSPTDIAVASDSPPTSEVFWSRQSRPDASSVAVLGPPRRLTSPDGLSAVVLKLAERPDRAEATVAESGRFRPSSLDWTFTAELQTDGLAWQRMLNIDRQLAIESVTLTVGGVERVVRWSRPPQANRRSDRVTLLIEEPALGRQTLTVSGRMPLRAVGRTRTLPRVHLLGVAVSGSTLELENQTGVPIELFDSDGEPLSNPASGSESTSSTDDRTVLGGSERRAFPDRSARPAGFRLRRITDPPRVETAAVIDAGRRIDYLVRTVSMTALPARVTLSTPPAGRISGAAVIDSSGPTGGDAAGQFRPGPEQSAVRSGGSMAAGSTVSLLAAPGLGSVVRIESVAADTESRLPEVTAAGRPVDRRLLVLPIEDRLEPVEGRKLARTAWPRWLLTGLVDGAGPAEITAPVEMRWTVWDCRGPIELRRRSESVTAPATTATTTLHLAQSDQESLPLQVTGHSVLRWASPTTVSLGSPSGVIAATLDNDPVDLADPSVGFGRQLQLWHAGVGWSRLPEIVTTAQTATIELVPPPGQAIERVGDRSPAASGPRQVDTFRPDDFRLTRPLRPGTGYVLSLLTLHLLAAAAIRRQRWAIRLPDLFADQVWIGTAGFGLFWWLLLSPSLPGAMLVVVGLLGSIVREIGRAREMVVGESTPG